MHALYKLVSCQVLQNKLGDSVIPVIEPAIKDKEEDENKSNLMKTCKEIEIFVQQHLRDKKGKNKGDTKNKSSRMVTRRGGNLS